MLLSYLLNFNYIKQFLSSDSEESDNNFNPDVRPESLVVIATNITNDSNVINNRIEPDNESNPNITDHIKTYVYTNAEELSYEMGNDNEIRLRDALIKEIQDKSYQGLMLTLREFFTDKHRKLRIECVNNLRDLIVILIMININLSSIYFDLNEASWNQTSEKEKIKYINNIKEIKEDDGDIYKYFVRQLPMERVKIIVDTNVKKEFENYDELGFNIIINKKRKLLEQEYKILHDWQNELKRLIELNQ